jgi:transcriptional regulator with XRE-family HTH domain
VDIREIIANRMKERGITQVALQELAGVHQVRISDYLTGKRDVNAETLRKMLEALELEIRPATRRRKGR